jgi:hypothetical protein
VEETLLPWVHVICADRGDSSLSKHREIEDVWGEIMASVRSHKDRIVLDMHTFRISMSELNKLIHWCGEEVPAPLRELYAGGDIFRYPWTSIDFIDPRENAIENHDTLMHRYAPPMQLPKQVRGPVHFGPGMVPFAYHGDSYYCLDCDPVLEEGGILHQVVNVSCHTGKVKVVEKSLLAFLEKGLKQQKKDIQKDQLAQAKAKSEQNESLNAVLDQHIEALRNKILSGLATPAEAAFAEKFFGISVGEPGTVRSKAEPAEAPDVGNERAPELMPKTALEGNPESRDADLAASPQSLPDMQDVEEKRQQAYALIAQNPKAHPVQKACVRLLELYAEYADCAAPSTHDEDEDMADILPDDEIILMERVNGTSAGLSEEAVLRYEKGLGVVFPEDLRALLAAHEFIAHGGRYAGSLGISWNLVEDCRQMNQAIADFIDEEAWALWPGTRAPVMGKNLIPIGWEEPCLCYDLNPGAGGVVGQLVSVDIECTTCKVEYPSLLALLEQSIREIEH